MAVGDFIRSLQAEDWLTAAYEGHLNTRRELERWSTPSSFVRPSAAGGPCPLDAELAMLGHHDEFSAKSQERVKNGKDVHARVSDNFAEAGLLAAESVRVTFFADGLVHNNLTDSALFDENGRTLPMLLASVQNHGRVTWSGEADDIVRNPKTGRLHLVEVKSASRFSWGTVPKQAASPEEMYNRLLIELAPYMRHYPRQLAQYLVQFQQAGEIPGLGTIEDTAFLYFENTDTQEYKIRVVRPSAKMRKEAFKVAGVAETAAFSGTLLDPPFARGSAECRACYREELCNALRDGKEEPWTRVRQALAQVSSGA